MKQKIFFLLFFTTFTFIFSTTATPYKPIEEKPFRMTEEQIAQRMKEMRKRVEEIKGIDRASLTKEERKALRIELREMNKEAKAMDQRGVYLSFGAIIIIILLLILIL